MKKSEYASENRDRDGVLVLMKNTLERKREELRGLPPAEQNERRLLQVEIDDAEQMIAERESELRASVV